MPKNLLDKIWDAHQVAPETTATPAILYIDLHLVHEVTSPQAFSELRDRGLKVRSPERIVATIDHSTPTLPADGNGKHPYANAAAESQVHQLQANAQEFGIKLYGWNSAHRGIVHVIGPELGATQPGMTIVCGDSHTSTHGAFGALAFGIGTTEVGHVLATQCLLQRKPKSLAITVNGQRKPGVTAKDLILHIIGKIGINGGTGFVIEYRGDAIRALTMEERMTVCNMSIEAGAKAGLIGADETTFAFLNGRESVPKDIAFDAAVARWSAFKSDADAAFDREVVIDATTVRPSITYGTHPGMVATLDALVPAANNPQEQRALDYMHLRAGEKLLGTPVDLVFVGSCTNGRLSDLRAAASVLRGHTIASSVRMLVVPGSVQVKRDAEAEGLHEIFLRAGAEWREAGCSMCLGMNGDIGAPGQLVVSTSNRNFEGRQGPGVRTILASPLVAAASAIAGVVADPAQYLSEAA